MRLLSIAKLQNLKAIHNPKYSYLLHYLVVINRKTTKFESNSQPPACCSLMSCCCYQSQNYKIWKQFTTARMPKSRKGALLSIAKLQNLKAIHNTGYRAELRIKVVINRKTTKFESNSQLFLFFINQIVCCYQSQNYKIWKQFTTVIKNIIPQLLLLSIAKLQNLKAIHNG